MPGYKRVLSGYLKGVGIEIGALDHPMRVPKGTKILHVDRLDKDALCRQYPELKKAEIADVDVVASIETIDSAFPPNSLDFVIANHIIEHVNDPLGALIQVHRVLREGGVLHLAVPDRRATFDRDRPRTTLSHCISDHEISSELQREKRDFLHYEEWVAKVPQYCPKEQRDYQSNLEQLWKNRYPIHFHVWEPDDWPEIINYLNEIDYPYRLLDYSNVFCPEQRNEFILILRKEKAPVQQLENTLREKGPIRWYITRLFLCLFIRPLKPLRHPLIHFWRRHWEAKS